MPRSCISWKGSQIFVKNTTPLAQPVVETGEKIQLLELAKANASSAAGSEVLSKEEAAEPVVETAVAEADETPAEGVENAQEGVAQAPTQEVTPKRSGRLTAVKAAFKQPRFVVEFVAWVVALAILFAALLGYGLQKSKNTLVYGVGDKCPEFILQTYESANNPNKENFSTFGFDKVTVLNYWYTDCAPCKNELPEFEKVYEEYDGAINMVVIHSWSALPKPGGMADNGVQDFLDTEKDKNGRAWNSYELVFAQDTQELDTYAQLGGKTAYPMTVIVNERGRITYVKQGSCSEELLRREIEKALN